MPVYADSGPKALPPAHQAVDPEWYGYDIEPPEPAFPLAHYLWILRRHQWKILAFVAASVAAAFLVSARLTPIYQSTVTVEIDRQIPSAIIGQDTGPASLNDLDQFLATQVKLIQSDSVLRPVAEQYHLPGAGILRNLTVTRPPNTYLLLIRFRSPIPHQAADVANAVAHSYVQHTYEIRIRSSAAMADFMQKQLAELKARMERSSAAVARFERELNVIDPEQKTSILSARLLQLNTDYTNAQSDRMQKESAWRAVEGGSLEAAQASTQGENLKAISARLDEAREKFADVRTHYGPNHPVYRKAVAQVAQIEAELQQSRKNAAQRVEVEYREAANREALLQKALMDTKAEFDRLNASSFEYQSRKREADADKSLYAELVRKIQEAGINAGFQNSSVRIADLARPAGKPVFPNTKLNAALAFLFATLLAVSCAFAADSLDGSVRDPQQVRALFQTDVIGSLPRAQRLRHPLITAPSGELIAAQQDPAVSGFEDAVRILRNSILLGSFDRRVRSLMITSATPAEGKTTTAVHLAIAHAQQKNKTLLIDCDLRGSEVHTVLGMRPESGLAAALQNGMQWRQKLVKLPELGDLDILSAGTSSRRAADLIGRSLPRILSEAREYDLIVVDSPPVLGFPEPLQLAAAVDGVVMVAKAGATSRAAVSSALGTLQHVHANVLGVVLNSVTRNMRGSYRYYGYYGTNYRRHGFARAAAGPH